MPYILLLIAVVFETIGTAALKASEGFTKPLPIALVVIGYGISFYLLAQVLKVLPVGIAYALWCALGIAFITIIGWIHFGERLGPTALGGLALITAGVVLLSQSPAANVH